MLNDGVISQTGRAIP